MNEFEKWWTPERMHHSKLQVAVDIDQVNKIAKAAWQAAIEKAASAAKRACTCKYYSDPMGRCGYCVLEAKIRSDR